MTIYVNVTYCETGEKISDFEINDFVKKIVDSKASVFISVSTGLIIEALRVEHAKGNIILNISFEGEQLEIDKNASIKNWPKGFLDIEEACLAELFKISRKNKKG